MAVLDRNHSPGSGGIFWLEIAATLSERPDVLLQDYLVGLGGGDVTPENINAIIDDLNAAHNVIGAGMEGHFNMSAVTPSKPYESHLLRPGNTNCAGCGMSIGLQWLDEALGDEQPVLVIPSCCGIVTAGAFPTSGYGVPTAATTFASSPAVATGISSVSSHERYRQPGDLLGRRRRHL